MKLQFIQHRMLSLNIQETDFQYVSTLEYKKFMKDMVENVADITTTIQDFVEEVVLTPVNIFLTVNSQHEIEYPVFTDTNVVAYTGELNYTTRETIYESAQDVTDY